MAATVERLGHRHSRGHEGGDPGHGKLMSYGHPPQNHGMTYSGYNKTCCCDVDGITKIPEQGREVIKEVTVVI